MAQVVACCICEEGEGSNIYEEDDEEYRFCDFCSEWFRVLKKAEPKKKTTLIIESMKKLTRAKPF